MKISHALLRLTILTHALSTTTTLANVPPLVDGYVDTKSIKNREPDFLQVNGTDLVLEQRGVDNSNIESRQFGAIILGVIVVSAIVTGIVAGLVSYIGDDTPRREAYTQQVVSDLYANNSNANYVVCHTKYDFSFDGTQGTDWDHLHHELPVSFGRTIGYDIYWFRSGTFRRWGDGGFINWAYIGNVISNSGGSPDVVVFG
ncbi:hypothetical protein L208DRAFT_101092 [Tricholoma matsutake]|nr:hypothetical protein L208DRAFT_101092 [Tricholoma matsutake 945]